MTLWKPDPTFYPSPRLAMQAPPEGLAYVAALNPNQDGRPDAITVVDVAPGSPTYGKVVGRVEMPHTGDELHHFGWNACSSALCPYAPHPHIERRYLVVPGLRSSRIHILDVKPDPRQPQIVKVIEPEEVFARAGIPGSIRSTAARKASMSAPWAPPTATDPAGSSCSTTTPSTCSAAGRWTADPSISPTTSGGI